MNYRKKFIEDMDKHTKNDRIKTLYDKEMHDGKFGVIEYCPRGDNSRVTIWVYDSGTWQMSRREYTDEINGRRMYGRIDTAEKAEGELGPSDAP